jgi:hypothetical protein
MVKTGLDQAAANSDSTVGDQVETGGQYKHFREAVKRLTGCSMTSMMQEAVMVTIKKPEAAIASGFDCR